MKSFIGRMIIENDGTVYVPVGFYSDAGVFQENTLLELSPSDVITNGLRATVQAAVLAYSDTNEFGMVASDTLISTYLADFTGDSGSGGTRGAVPAPATGDSSKFLKGNGTWATPAGGSEAFPVGSVFIAVVSTDPATLLGYGTWSAFATGRTIVGFDSGQTDFDTVEETGGAKTHTLQTTEIPAHTHVISSQTATTGGATSYEHGTLDTSSAEAEVTEVTGSTGGGGAHNNLQPYIVVYMWKRTA